MKKPTSRKFSSAASTNSGKVSSVDSNVLKPPSKPRRYVYTEQDLGLDRLHMGITAATYVALSTAAFQ